MGSSRIIGSLKRAARSFLSYPAIASRLHKSDAQCAILAYHRVTSRKPFAGGFDPNVNIAVRVDRFEQQLRFLSRKMRCLTIDELVSDLDRRDVRPGSVVVTFDDGYLDNLVVAKPMLDHYRVPAIVYVTTDFLEGRLRPWWYELENIILHRKEISGVIRGERYQRMTESCLQKSVVYEEIADIFKELPVGEIEDFLGSVRGGDVPPAREDVPFLTKDQLRVLAESPNILIGAHTVSHSGLGALSKDEVLRELNDSREQLESIVGRSVRHLAFPFGQAGAREFELARELGFISAVTIEFGLVGRHDKERLWSLPRVHVDYEDTLGDVRYKISGLASARRRGGWYTPW